MKLINCLVKVTRSQQINFINGMCVLREISQEVKNIPQNRTQFHLLNMLLRIIYGEKCQDQQSCYDQIQTEGMIVLDKSVQLNKQSSEMEINLVLREIQNWIGSSTSCTK